MSGKIYQINGVLDCNSSGCAYKILCQQCRDFVYFGETGNALRIRFSQHKSDIVTYKKTPVAEHFNLPGHGLRDVIFIGIEKVVPNSDPFLCKERESFYIRRGDTVHKGANRRF